MISYSKPKVLTIFAMIVSIIAVAGIFAVELMSLTGKLDDVQVTGNPESYICVSWEEKTKQDTARGIRYKREDQLRNRIEDRGD